MSRLYVSADSDTCKTTRTARGSRRVSAHPRGWRAGVSAEAIVMPTAENPERITFHVERTTGSSAAGASRYLAFFADDSPAVGFFARSGDTIRVERGENRPADVFQVGEDGILRPYDGPETA